LEKVLASDSDDGPDYAASMAGASGDVGRPFTSAGEDMQDITDEETGERVTAQQILIEFVYLPVCYD
jgi:hypothetical protein